jgi:hypothetical protein
MARHYYLNEDKSVAPCDLLTWASQLETMRKHVADDSLHGHRVSTVWLGLNHNHQEADPPLLFETIIFNHKKEDVYLERYSSWQEAEEGHKKAIEWLKEQK